MSDDFLGHIEKIIKNAEMTKLRNMLENTGVSEESKNFLKDIISYKKFSEQKKTKKTNDNNKPKETEEKSAEKLINTYLYQRPWNKLYEVHKKNKLNEYINSSLFNTTDENIKDIKKQLLTDFENGKLKSGKTVQYDPMSAKILGISGLNYNSKTSQYEYKVKKQSSNNYYKKNKWSKQKRRG